MNPASVVYSAKRRGQRHRADSRDGFALDHHGADSPGRFEGTRDHPRAACDDGALLLSVYPSDTSSGGLIRRNSHHSVRS